MTEFELTINPNNLTKKLNTLRLLGNHGLSSISLTNKANDDDLISISGNIWAKLPTTHITFTYSIKQHYGGGKAQAIQQFQTFQKLLLGQPHSDYQILLVSGSQKRSLDTLSLLPSVTTSVAVAYNPFLSGADLDTENHRLKQKLSFEIVQRVYIQIGVDEQIIEKSINYIRNLRPDIAISICVMYPNQRLLQNWSFRPWHGVFLSKQYLENLSFAQMYAQKIIQKCLQEWQVDTLISWFEDDEKLRKWLQWFLLI